MADVSVIIPFGHRNDHEDLLFAWCYRRWQREFPDFELLVGDGGRPFNRSRARNHVASLATGQVFVFINADTTWLDPVDIRRATDSAGDGTWVLPAAYVETTEDYALGVIHGAAPVMPPATQYSRIRDMSCAGPQIVSREQWEQAGRFDEGFTGWGWEDAAFRDAVDVLCGHHARIGTSLHLWHPKPVDAVGGHPSFRAMRARGRRYSEARRAGRAAMLHLVRSRQA